MQERDAQAPFLLEKNTHSPVRIHGEISDVDMAIKITEEDEWTREREIELLRDIKSGDTEAKGLLWKHYGPQVYYFIKSRVGDHHIAEEVTSNVSMKFIGAIEKYEDRGIPLGAYLNRIAKNEIINNKRRNKSSLSLEKTTQIHEGFVDFDPSVDPQLCVEASEASEAELFVREALMRLKPYHRQILKMKHDDEMSYADMMVIIGKPVNTLRVDVHRALGQLRKVLKSLDRDQRFGEGVA